MAHSKLAENSQTHDEPVEERLFARVRSHLRGAIGSGAQGSARFELRSVRPLIGGACQDNFVVSARINGEERRLALRSDARSTLMNSISRRVEGPVVNAAADVGVATPRALWAGENVVRDGAACYFMPWVEGVAIGRKVVAAAELSACREKLADKLAVELARIHTIVPTSHPQLFNGAGPPLNAATRAFDDLAGYLSELPATRPAMARIAAWLDANLPSPGPIVLNHGDFRTGNFMLTPAGLAGILDWEFSHWGSAAEDVTWICVRDWRFGRLKLPVGGFAKRAAFLSAYENAAGARLDPTVLLWWEVMGNARWAVGAVQQAVRYLSGKERDLEHLAIGRRVVEMEWEALRLIRTGVPAWRAS